MIAEMAGGQTMSGKAIVMAQQKGGSGKTTLSANLAVAFAEAGRDVALLDTDPQGSLGRWFMTRRETKADAGLEFGTASAWGVSYECEKLKKTHDLVIIDTPPKIDADLRPALREADLVIVPIATSHVDIWATEGVLELARRERRPVMIVLNRAAARARLTGEVREALSQFDAHHANTQLGNRVIYAEALGLGLGVSEKTRSSPATAEILALMSEIEKVIGAV